MQQLISWSKNLAVLHFKQILLKLGESGFPPYKMVLKNLFEMLINLNLQVPNGLLRDVRSK